MNRAMKFFHSTTSDGVFRKLFRKRKRETRYRFTCAPNEASHTADKFIEILLLFPQEITARVFNKLPDNLKQHFTKVGK